MPDGLDQNDLFQPTFLRGENFAFESFYFTELEKLASVNAFIKNNSVFLCSFAADFSRRVLKRLCAWARWQATLKDIFELFKGFTCTQRRRHSIFRSNKSA